MSNEKETNLTSFGLGTFFISAGLLTLFLIENWFKYLGIPFFWFGFLGLATELDKKNYKDYYLYLAGFPSLITALYFVEFKAVFIFFFSFAVSTFIPGVIRTFIRKKERKRENIEANKENTIIGYLTVIGSICSAIEPIIALWTSF